LGQSEKLTGHCGSGQRRDARVYRHSNKPHRPAQRITHARRRRPPHLRRTGPDRHQAQCRVQAAHVLASTHRSSISDLEIADMPNGTPDQQRHRGIALDLPLPHHRPSQPCPSQLADAKVRDSRDVSPHRAMNVASWVLSPIFLAMCGETRRTGDAKRGPRDQVAAGTNPSRSESWAIACIQACLYATTTD
jgi:hypothetical protein